MNFERRIKNRIKARKHKFFAVFPPEFTDIVCNELKTFDIEEVNSFKGGMEFISKIDECYKINLESFSITRILLRIAEFKVMFFSEFRKKISYIDWELYLSRDVPVSFKISTSYSRLYHTDRLEEETVKGITKRLSSVFEDFNGLKIAKDFQTVFVRIENNRVTVSVDSTGNSLYMRNIKKNISEAPLRENIASLLLKKASFDKYSGIIDPMSGSGTFSIEAAMMNKNIPAGFYRDYAFKYWPVFREAAFKFLKNKKPEKLEISIYTSDIDGNCVKIIEENLKNAALEIKVYNDDFFKLKGNDFADKNLLVLNPPYGKRLEKNTAILDFYKKVCDKIKSDFSNQGLLLLIPSGLDFTKLDIDYDEVFKFNHGGMKINALIKNNFGE